MSEHAKNFRRISARIALQFMGFVFLLFLINGSIFLAVDFGNARRMAHGRLLRDAQMVLNQAEQVFQGGTLALPPPVEERMRILDADGQVLHAGWLFSDIPSFMTEGYTTIEVREEPYTVLTIPLSENDHVYGFAQVAGMERLPMRDLPLRWGLYLFVSILVSALTFVVGLFFARRSLKPAEQMMERLEQFTQDASHELKTPLAALSSSLDLAMKNGKYREGIESAKVDLKQVTVLVERLLELARLDKFVSADESIDLTRLVETSVERFRSLVREKHVVIEQTVAQNVTVNGDAILIQQILSNLLSNAIKFSKPAGGKIHVRLTPKEFSVEDNGMGIPAESLPLIFDRFYQAEPSRAMGGFGLGLALVKRIVELHGWTVSARSTLGSGTTFTVYFGTQTRKARS
ncbi:MAG: HAMP domain-containing sensor histidine kinase [Candidatus Peribacteraceae bacterium]|nr:HAMP domain-containing sensor histidine kinase [Candidatus Peribacteraceae bacterium]MDD5739802.1 HAMP domain-containing sensor histidine kinase [Candidatus Peribacteraceae bacterium]